MGCGGETLEEGMNDERLHTHHEVGVLELVAADGGRTMVGLAGTRAAGALPWFVASPMGLKTWTLLASGAPIR